MITSRWSGKCNVPFSDRVGRGAVASHVHRCIISWTSFSDNVDGFRGVGAFAIFAELATIGRGVLSLYDGFDCVESLADTRVASGGSNFCRFVGLEEGVALDWPSFFGLASARPLSNSLFFEIFSSLCLSYSVVIANLRM